MARQLYSTSLSFAILLLLMMVVDVIQCSTTADAVYSELKSFGPFFDRVKEAVDKMDKPNYRYLASDKANYLAQVGARIKMTQSAYDELVQLFTTKFGPLSGYPAIEFESGDLEKAKDLLAIVKESKEWFDIFERLFDVETRFNRFHDKLSKCERILKEAKAKLDSHSPKLANRKVVIDELQSRLDKFKPLLDNYAPIFTREMDNVKADVVDHKFFVKFIPIESEYATKSSKILDLEDDCDELPAKFNDWLLLVDSDNDESDQEAPQDYPEVKRAKAELRNQRKLRNEQKDKLGRILYRLGVIFDNRAKGKARLEAREVRDALRQSWSGVQEAKRKVKEAKQNSASIQASNSSGPEKNQEKPLILSESGLGENQEKVIPPVIPSVIPNNDTQSFQEDERPFWKKKRYNIPASIAGITLFGGWMLDLHNIIPQMIGWGSKENDSSTKVNPPNSTTTDTSTDEPTHQVEYLTVVIIVLVVLALLVVVIAVLLKRYKNGTSDLDRGKPSHKSQAASTMASTTTGTEIPLTPTRSTNTTSSKANSKKDSPGPASTPASTKTKSKRSSQK